MDWETTRKRSMTKLLQCLSEAKDVAFSHQFPRRDAVGVDAHNAAKDKLALAEDKLAREMSKPHEATQEDLDEHRDVPTSCTIDQIRSIADTLGVSRVLPTVTQSHANYRELMRAYDAGEECDLR